MDGQIYRVPIQGQTQNLPHPHVVLIELEKECWLIPAFGADGPEVQSLLKALQVMGVPAGDVAVEMDNAVYVTYRHGFTGIKAYWVVARAVKITKAQLRTYENLGKMNDEGLLALARAVERLAKSRPDIISVSLQKKIRKLIESLVAKASPDAGP
jgi:hypothetical protein